MHGYRVFAPDGVGEIVAGQDLAAVLLAALEAEGEPPADGDVVLVTSKVVSKAEGLVRTGDRAEAVEREAVRVLARRGPTRIVRTRHGLTLAAAGIDASNVPFGRYLLLPPDPDGTARAIRQRLADLAGVNVAVLITDTAGRAWREGQTDLCIGAAGIEVLEGFAGRPDGYGNQLAVTAPAVADQLAGAAELAQGKVAGRPFAIVRGLADRILDADDAGPGAAALVREEGSDMFGYGAREAVLAALRGEPSEQPAFGRPADPGELATALHALAPDTTAPHVSDDGAGLDIARDERLGRPVVAALCFAFGHRLGTWQENGDTVRVGLRTPTP